jgi:uncharacterized membrane protein
MKQFLFALLFGIFLFVFIYLLCAFYNTTFDISKWTANGRGVCAVIGGMLFFIAVCSQYMAFEEKHS